LFQIRIHGRGGQGVVTAAEMLSVAAFNEGRHAQAFPSFGSERAGAPVVAFCRIDDAEIRAHEPIAEPDALVIQDPTLLHQVDLFNGLEPGGYVLINSSRSFEQLGIGELAERFDPQRLLSVPATELARRHLGRPIPNVVMLGGFAALTGAISFSSLAAAVVEKLPGQVGERNVTAARAAYEHVEGVVGERVGA
jgi:pyruvate ferredoxin oxidoreductase gamma subunit